MKVRVVMAMVSSSGTRNTSVAPGFDLTSQTLRRLKFIIAREKL